MEQYSVCAAAAPTRRQPLCRLADDRDGWGDNFLAPILRGAGYRVIADGDMSDEAPDVVLCLTGDGETCSHAGEIGRAHSELQSLMRISYAVFCLKKKKH